MSDKVIDVPAESEPSQALTVRDAQQAIQALEKTTDKPPITAAQAKIEAVANLTATAYSKASELRLTQEESAALLAPFQDSDFQPGAAGKESLIYIQHSALRDRFTKVLGLGQWALIARSRWAQEDRDCTLVFVEAMLMIRGCFVSEAIGDMAFWPKNKSTNYGDAVEGATTQAFRRCAKHFGVGLQAWDKDWCNGWWERRNAGREGAARQQQTTRIEHPRNQMSATPKSQTTPQQQVLGEIDCPVCEVVMVAEKTGTTNGKPWKVYFVKFNDGFTDLEAGTFDSKIADLANEISTSNGKARVVTKPGRKPGSREIVLLERAGSALAKAPEVDDVPFDFDEHGQPIQEVTP